MGINFAAANMEGYNNPEVYILRVSLNAESGEVVSAPRVSDINNIIKSGFIPVICLTGGGNTFVISLTSISTDGDYIFSSTYVATDGSFTPILTTLVFSQNSDNPTLISKPLQEAGA